jgi:hypothetical protein
MKLRKSIAAVVVGSALLAGAVTSGPATALAADLVPKKQEQKASAVVPAGEGRSRGVTINLAATANEPRKLCEYESPQGCVGWYPNWNTCRDISHHGTPAQIRACLLWSGFGSRG